LLRHGNDHGKHSSSSVRSHSGPEEKACGEEESGKKEGCEKSSEKSSKEESNEKESHKEKGIWKKSGQEKSKEKNGKKKTITISVRLIGLPERSGALFYHPRRKSSAFMPRRMSMTKGRTGFKIL
jgi:hypothetical protein